MPIPRNAMKLAADLFPASGERDAFLAALFLPQPYRPALIWLGRRPEASPFSLLPPCGWQPDFVDRLAAGQRPGQHPLHAAGAYYCLDVSSAFAASATLATPPRPQRVLDVCASPGGKSIFAWRGLEPARLIANEVIGKRHAALIANLTRCRIRPAAVISADSSRLASACPGAADLVLVDAPCSGQSLVVLGKDSPGCFHPATINQNANRQRRILANATALVAPGGYLAYITCTFARKENESVVRWLLDKFPVFAARSVPQLAGYQSHLSDDPCYRIWPQSGEAAGAFCALLQRCEDGPCGTWNDRAFRQAWVS